MENIEAKETAKRAINQLLSLIVGTKFAKQTDSLKTEPIARLKKCIELTLNEYSEAMSLQSDCVPDAQRMITQAQRKLDSLNSLTILANLIPK